MTVIVYKCDTCNRDVALPQNKQGLESIGRCIITQGCRGKLHQSDVKPDFVRGTFPPSVPNLTDWTQRRVLYTHTQTVKSKQWKVVHNLGVKPTIQVFIVNLYGQQEEIFPDKITTIDLNQVMIEFSQLESGVAQCTSSSSANTINQEITMINNITTLQLSSSSELTIATLATNASVTLDLTFKADTDQVVQYTVDNSPSIISPWRDTSKVLIKNKSYVVRSFQILNSLILDGTIRNGVAVNFTMLDAAPINNESVLILLANPPFQTADKINNMYVNTSRIDSSLPQLYYNDGNFFIPNTLTNSTFPNIRSI